uniref:HTH_Tnp_Tc3_1 domain-containing protein n=1 Tax=Heterorhabditis bacteriophora TaxID=37862 RepID=A0A1I7XJL2_HETBA
MSRRKNIPSNQRVMIEVLLDQNLGQVQIAKKNRRARVALAREHLTWSTADCSKVFNRFGSDGKKYVRRRPGEEFMPKCTIPSIKHGGGSVMVWVAFNRNGVGLLHIVEGIMDSTS